MSEDKKHTPLPYRVYQEKEGEPVWVTSDEGRKDICVSPDFSSDDSDKANAEFIVRACNSHYELLTIAREFLCERNTRQDAHFARTGKQKPSLKAEIAFIEAAIAKARQS